MSTSPTSFKQINPSILQQIAGQTAFGTVKAEMGVAKGSHGEGGGGAGMHSLLPHGYFIFGSNVKLRT